MVFKNIQRIKSALPEVFHVAMFYNTGTIFQATFEQNINVPKLGENLAELLNHVRKIYEICDFKMENYRKFIIETDDISTIIIKLGEDSNLALFFKKEEDKDLKLTAIRRYLHRIEDLSDTDETEILFLELATREKNLKIIEENFEQKQQKIRDLQTQMMDKPLSESELGDINKAIKNLEDECEYLRQEIEQKKSENLIITQKLESKKKAP
jgi:predicted regulator of Ras-like GTPase activity (Roadblock/LC7/MglB family)